MSRASHRSTLPALSTPLPMAVVVSADVMLSMVRMVTPTMVPMMETGALDRATDLGDPLRGRAFRCNLRFAPISAAIPVASIRFAHSELRLAGGSLRSPPLPDRHVRGKVPPHRPLHRRCLLASALRAALVSVLASLALAGCAGCGHRLGSSWPRPVRRRRRLRRAPESALRRARPAAPLSPLVRALPHFAPHGVGRTARRSLAAAAPMSRRRRRRFPERRCCRLAVPDRPGRPWVSHPTHR